MTQRTTARPKHAAKGSTAVARNSRSRTFATVVKLVCVVEWGATSLSFFFLVRVLDDGDLV